MTLTDLHGHALTGATADSLEAYEHAQRELRCYIGDPVASVDRALAASPGMTMAHLLKAWLHLLGTEPGGLAVARACCDAAATLPATERERSHLHATTLLTAGRWRDAGRALEDLSLRYPRDVLALQAGHQIDFFTGDSRLLRDRIARALPAWQRGMPGHHAVLGMHAFGLEETGDYVQAERQGRLAVEQEPRDGWAWHAVTHVLEMRNQPQEGIAWLAPHEATWSDESFLAVHNRWHLALFHLELDEVDEVLALYDRGIGGPGSSVLLDLVDASAMLWRLHLRGAVLGERWQALADRWAAAGMPGQYAFNDLHAMIAFVGADRPREQAAVIEAQRAAMAQEESDNAAFTRDVGHPAALAVQAFGQGDFARCCELLRPIRSRAHRFGGSHAQRDLIDLSLLEAALRGGDAVLAEALAAERVALRPHSAPAQRFMSRSQPLARAA